MLRTLGVAKNNMDRISRHITYAESIHSNTAKRRGIDNTPNPTQVENMKLTAEKVFEPLRDCVKVKQLILMMYMVVKQTQKCTRG